VSALSVRCLVLVKMHGNNPRKLSVKMVRNTDDVRIKEFPLFSFPFLRIVFMSWCCLFVCLLLNLLLYYFVVGLIRFLFGSAVVRWLFLY
jgi:hypothetical protein